eukprot:Protomagalhaensia_sp_Gyna_25__772@NODE_136_length_4955_cov_269_926973_g107_i0_p2_GENE_NODE_136_length_4955_cov_269_926973_g107_i0NODE_136_length_4955_cov_269_926973_g107_i0_p2_ORF_typecomplete_len324_score17_272OGFeII_Oxy_2/PF13532_6/1_7e31_NODE_136_length_4955_cov_269_926973_g107_i015602531
MDSFKTIDALVRDNGLTSLLLSERLTPINLVPLGKGGNSHWDQDLTTLLGDKRPDIEPLLYAANEKAAKPVSINQDACPTWLKDVKVYELNSHPGVYIIPQVFPEEYLLEVANNCVTTYPLLSNTNTNIGKLGPETRVQELLRGKGKLRWVSLGCDYDWTSRVYRTQSQLPEELAAKARDIASLLGYWDGFAPDCALVNYYGWRDRLRGHTDDVEEAIDMPLITISLGQPGIFLMGGHTREQIPDALVLRHGDCCIMSRESRKDYHGVPGLVYYNQKAGPKEVNKFPVHTQRFDNPVLNSHRINISIRQCWKIKRSSSIMAEE